ncbi:MAG: amidohydrolase family protein [Candidatus Bathyarchaeota archaeon]|nr:amidohydrolase family protein [Candidatus Bathyarchaeota archaeon]
MKSDNFKKIENEVNKIKIIDTHEHLQKEENRLKSEVDPLQLFLGQYVSSDLISSGMPIEDFNVVVNNQISIKDRWEKLSQYWDNVQNTGYAQALHIAVKDIYGVDGLEKNTITELTEKMKQLNKRGLYKTILKDKAGIEIALHDTILKAKDYDYWNIKPIAKTLDIDRSLFAPVHRFQDFLGIMERTDLDSLSRRLNYSIHSLEDLVKVFRTEFENLSSKIYAVKIWLAYRRSMFFEKTTYAEAEKTFNEIYKQDSFKRIDVSGTRLTFPEGISFKEAKPLQDFMVHEMIKLAIKHKLPLQIHTGIHEGNENIINNSNPTNLTNLFLEYKEAKFDIFHAGYPFLEETAAIVKNFQNVYVDLCWLHIISPSTARRVLYEWLDTLPINKILGFGGDYTFIEGSYGHSVIARRNVTNVLQRKIDEGIVTLDETIKIAKRLLRENAIELFFQEKPLHSSRLD